MKPVLLIVTNGDKTSFATLARQLRTRLKDEFKIQIIPYQRVEPGAICDILLCLWWKPMAEGLHRRIKVKLSIILALFDHYSWTYTRYQKDKFREALRASDLLVVGNRMLLAEVRREYKTIPPTFICPTGIDIGQFKKLPFPSEFTALWCGNSLASKEATDLKGIKIIREACEIADVPLTIADSIGEKGDRLAYVAMPKWYGHGSVLMVGSQSEGTPRTLLEAMACGRPACTTRVGIVPEVVQHGINGVIVDRNPNAMAAGLQYLKRNIKRNPDKIQAAARKAAEAHSMNNKIGNWRACLNAAAEGPWWRGSVVESIPAPEPGGIKPILATKREDMMIDPMLAKDLKAVEVQELRGKAMDPATLQTIVDEVDQDNKPRPVIVVPSTWRFVSRTLKLIRHMTDRYKFIIGEGNGDLIWSLYPFGDGRWARSMHVEHGAPYVQTLRGAFWTMNPDLTNTALEVLHDASVIVPLTRSLQDETVVKWPGLIQKRFEIIHNGGYANSVGHRQVFGPHSNYRRPIVLCSTNFKFEEKRRAIDEMVHELEATAFRGSFLVVGQEGAYRPKTTNLGRCSYYLGFLRNRFEILNGADVFWYHSYRDGQPSSLMEAMSAGLACVVVKAPNSGAHEFIEDGITGFVARDARHGAELVNALVSSAVMKKELGANAREAMRTKYTWKAAAEKYMSLFDELRSVK